MKKMEMEKAIPDEDQNFIENVKNVQKGFKQKIADKENISNIKTKKTIKDVPTFIKNINPKLAKEAGPSNLNKKKDRENKIRAVLNTSVSWEIKQNDRVLTQCHRCQLWGHATYNGHRQARSLKCAQDHGTATCTKSRDTDAKCCNCKGDHTANSVKCPVYIKKVEEHEARIAKSHIPSNSSQHHHPQRKSPGYEDKAAQE
ncbi:hypothetical protein JTB14_000239 [Gonioctena quinquepunctata]|nr:hypothetical protein JTB14_000239 [Gonioctena quinquepunctata]